MAGRIRLCYSEFRILRNGQDAHLRIVSALKVGQLFRLVACVHDADNILLARLVLADILTALEQAGAGIGQRAFHETLGEWRGEARDIDILSVEGHLHVLLFIGRLLPVCHIHDSDRLHGVTLAHHTLRERH